MPATAQDGTVITYDPATQEGTLEDFMSGNNENFQNPVDFGLTPGGKVSYVVITNPAKGTTKVVITGNG